MTKHDKSQPTRVMNDNSSVYNHYFSEIKAFCQLQYAILQFILSIFYLGVLLHSTLSFSNMGVDV